METGTHNHGETPANSDSPTNITQQNRRSRLLVVFALFALGQFCTGGLLYYKKIGFHPAQALEHYAGSEAMLRRYPTRPDRFRQPRSFQGLIKIATWHLPAYGILVLALTHLLTGLVGHGRKRALARGLSVALFVFALADVGSGFFARFGPAWAVHVRLLCFVAFETTGILAASWLIAITLAGSRQPAAPEAVV